MSINSLKSKIKHKSTQQEVDEIVKEIQKENSHELNFGKSGPGFHRSIEYILLQREQEDSLWALLDRMKWSPTKEYTFKGTDYSYSLLSLAAEIGNIKFVNQWIQRGLPLDMPGWKHSPLTSAIIFGKGKVVKALSDAGANWEKSALYTTCQITSVGPGTVIQKSMKPWVVGILSENLECFIAANEKKKMSTGDWNERIDSKRQFPSIKKGFSTTLADLLIAFLEEGRDRGYATPPVGWWTALRKSQNFQMFKESEHGGRVDWDKIYSTSVSPSMYAGLATGTVKSCSEDDLIQCLKLLGSARYGVKDKNMTTVKSFLTAEREKALWAPGGITEKHLTDQGHPFPKIVLNNWNQKNFWKTGASNPVLSLLFFDSIFNSHLDHVLSLGNRISYNYTISSRFPFAFEVDTEAQEKKLSKVFDTFWETAQRASEKEIADYKRIATHSNGKFAAVLTATYPAVGDQRVTKDGTVLDINNISNVIRHSMLNLSESIETYGMDDARQFISAKAFLNWSAEKNLITKEELLKVVVGKGDTTAVKYYKPKFESWQQQLEKKILTDKFSVVKVKKTKAL